MRHNVLLVTLSLAVCGNAFRNRTKRQFALQIGGLGVTFNGASRALKRALIQLFVQMSVRLVTLLILSPALVSL